MMGTMLFTDQDHILAKREIFPSLAVPKAERLLVSDCGAEGFLGFGAALTPASCYELSLMEPTERKALLTHLYGKAGIGLSIGRICIASSDYSAELYSYDDAENDTELLHFSTERDEAYVIPMIKEILEINPNLYLFASPWSPPYWMKTGGRMCGGYMRAEFVECYARYIVKFIESYKAHGIHIRALTPQNEVNTQQDGSMPACIWHPEIEAAFILELRKKLDAAGLDVKIWMHDHNFGDTARVIWLLENYKGLSESCDGVAFHYYGGAIEQTYEVTEKFPRLDLHFTEGGPRLTDNYSTDHCKWGRMAIKALQMGYKSFTGWNLMLNELGGPNIGPFIGICGGLVTRNSQDGTLSYSGQYRAFSHIAPYITKDSAFFPITVSRGYGQNMAEYPKAKLPIEGVLIKNPSGEQVAVLVNPNTYGMQTQIEIGGRLWYAELAADSVSTLIVTG